MNLNREFYKELQSNYLLETLESILDESEYRRFMSFLYMEKLGVTNYDLDESGLISVKGSLEIVDKSIEELPVTFKTVSGVFTLTCINLKTLKGCPETCNQFQCDNSSIVNLIGGPKYCKKYQVYDNPYLESLEGSPDDCYYFKVSSSKIKDLKGGPSKCTLFYTFNNNYLETLEGAPESCKSFYIYESPVLKSLEFLPKNCISLDCSYCYALNDFTGVGKYCKSVKCTGCYNLKSLKGLENCKELIVDKRMLIDRFEVPEGCKIIIYSH